MLDKSKVDNVIVEYKVTLKFVLPHKQFFFLLMQNQKVSSTYCIQILPF